jgi:hypothetical protein
MLTRSVLRLSFLVNLKFRDFDVSVAASLRSCRQMLILAAPAGQIVLSPEIRILNGAKLDLLRNPGLGTMAFGCCVGFNVVIHRYCLTLFCEQMPQPSWWRYAGPLRVLLLVCRRDPFVERFRLPSVLPPPVIPPASLLPRLAVVPWRLAYREKKKTSRMSLVRRTTTRIRPNGPHSVHSPKTRRRECPNQRRRRRRRRSRSSSSRRRSEEVSSNLHDEYGGQSSTGECPKCQENIKDRYGMRRHFMHRHLNDKIIIEEEGELQMPELRNVRESRSSPPRHEDVQDWKDPKRPET